MLYQIVVGILGFYLVYCGFLFLLQRHILFPRYQIPAPPDGTPLPPGLEKIRLETVSGKIEAWFIPPASGRGNQRAPAVIFGHGNGELIDFWPRELYPLARMGLGVLLVEYPGYGRSGGHPSQKSIGRAFVSAYDWLAARPDVDPDRIVFFGRSLGGGAVCDLSRRRPSAAMILMSAFTSVKAFAVRFLAPPVLIRDPFDNLDAVRSYRGPVLVIHGRYDEVIPYAHGSRLLQAASRGKMISYDCGHNDCPPDWGAFWQAVAAFLRENGIL